MRHRCPAVHRDSRKVGFAPKRQTGISVVRQGMGRRRRFLSSPRAAQLPVWSVWCLRQHGTRAGHSSHRPRLRAAQCTRTTIHLGHDCHAANPGRSPLVIAAHHHAPTSNPTAVSLAARPVPPSPSLPSLMAASWQASPTTPAVAQRRS